MSAVAWPTVLAKPVRRSTDGFLLPAGREPGPVSCQGTATQTFMLDSKLALSRGAQREGRPRYVEIGVAHCAQLAKLLGTGLLGLVPCLSRLVYDPVS